ncbi:phosphate acyltransferase PlsX [Nitrococcus mobilis]|uniref:Phosphate acyltransferase n=1 Tax=Nitrococcus mobilis Nb-231 TaxID=314278 RepID=A4BML8_9GAMM|nr:phosphate acyltransferase PlsX [Nitrococcus mobilis]EAR23556.1 fatty acid/phospholipid synthesis protein [Nitrococcus mobilis Nb-231]
MSQCFTIALDAMGGDHGPAAVVPAALRALNRHSGLVHLILVGRPEMVREELHRHGGQECEALRIHSASQVVDMAELPSQALRGKKDSSMRVAVNLVKEGVADACVSAGNTGALVAMARYVLKTLPGIDRPAICTTIPCLGGCFHMLDLGGNVDCAAEQLFRFAVMGSVLARASGTDSPRIGLMNLGEEEIKGNGQVKRAAQLLQASTLNYIGYVEGDSAYKGVADVVVCDGFVGNVALKSSEGVAFVISRYLQEAFHKNLLSKLAGLIALPVLHSLRRRLDPRQYNGASLLGLRGVVVKSHGGADAVAFERAIDVGILEAEKAVPRLIDERLREIFSQEQLQT